ncbi:MAG: hypothetical protein AB7G28_03100 [Pirellulales bacterium]
MSVSIHKMAGVLGVLSLLALVSGASAAPSIGYPVGRPYFGSGQQQARVFRNYGPSYVATDSRQSFSYEPTEKASGANKSQSGQQAAPQAPQKTEATPHAAAPRTTTRQSFSYEPTMQRRNSNRRDAWLYQKADARRLGQ